MCVRGVLRALREARVVYSSTQGARSARVCVRVHACVPVCACVFVCVHACGDPRLPYTHTVTHTYTPVLVAEGIDSEREHKRPLYLHSRTVGFLTCSISDLGGEIGGSSYLPTGTACAHTYTCTHVYHCTYAHAASTTWRARSGGTPGCVRGGRSTRAHCLMCWWTGCRW